MPTLRDVAKLAGVSYQTVSRTLNAPTTVLPATRKRVEQAVQELGYYPNAAARRLKLGRSRLLGIVTTDLTGFGPARTVQAFMDAAERDDWTVLVVRFDPRRTWDDIGDGSSTSFAALFEYDVQLVGLVGGTPEIAAAISRIAPSLPILNIGAPLPGYPSVGIDQEKAVTELVAHLVALGHRRIGHLAGPASSPDAVLREQSWHRAILSHDLPFLPALSGDWTATTAFQVLSAHTHLNFTALLCANDQSALGAIRALRIRGVDVPRDISVVGFDDIDEAANYHPTLTTAHQPFEMVGLHAAITMKTLLAHGDIESVQFINADIRIRDSTSVHTSL